MSAISCCVVLPIVSPTGVEAPAPRWSNSTARKNVGSKKRRCSGDEPPPGPPCRNSTGTPSGLPDVSQYIVCTSSSGSMPLSYGSIGGCNALRVSMRGV